MKTDLGAASDFEEGKCRIFELEGKSVGVVRWRGDFFAARNYCPHMGAQLCLGKVEAMLTGADPIGRVEPDEERPVLGCPWHGWQFDLRSGKSVSDERYKIRTYPIEVVDSRVLIDIPVSGSQPRADTASA